jgi:hypothetical protein
MAQEEIVRRQFAEADTASLGAIDLVKGASWSKMTPEDVAEFVREAATSSRLRLGEAAAGRDERLDHGSGFRESIRELRASTQEMTASLVADPPAKAENQTHSAARRV